MAKQHLYTRVPAKLSMFKKELSYDTFAVSKGINEAYIKENLQKLCDYRQSPNEKDYILNDSMPNIYMSYFSRKTGELIQTCISFLPNDFTGEKHGFFAHSLVLNGEETEKIIKDPASSLITTSNFIHELDKTGVDFEGEKPAVDYPAISYNIAPCKDPACLVEEYDNTMLKELIYAFLGATSKGNKTINIDLGTDDLRRFSDDSVDFLNSFFSIFPFHLRSKLTYVTYTADIKKSPMTFFKVRFVKDLDRQVVSSKQSFSFNFAKKTVIGVKTEDTGYKKASREVDFMFNLLSDKTKREDFLNFFDRVVPTAAEYRYEWLSSIILMYCRICECYEDDVILPNDDTVLELLNVYEKYRKLLTVTERCRVLGALNRYAEAKTVIPPQIFTKIRKIYISEPVPCKEVIMDVILTLIHTDGMRDKLFMFIKQTYPLETPAAREKISENLARVFYGQFLQTQILSLFSEYFDQESPATKVVILEKVVASVRSEQIQDQVIAFLDKYYMHLAPKLRNKVRSELYKELPEADKLTAKIINLFENHFLEEDEKTRERQIRSIFLRIEKAERTGNHKLIDIIMGDLYDLKPMSTELLKIILIDVKNVRVFEYLMKKMLSGKHLRGVHDAIAIIYGNYNELPPETESALREGVTQLIIVNEERCNLFDYIDLDNSMRETLAGMNSRPATELYNKLYKKYICRIVNDKIGDAFRNDLNENCLTVAHDFIIGKKEYISSACYDSLMKLKRIYDAMEAHETGKAVEIYTELNVPGEYRPAASGMLSTFFDKMYTDDPRSPRELTDKLEYEYFTEIAMPLAISCDPKWSEKAFVKCDSKLGALTVMLKRAELMRKKKKLKEIVPDRKVTAPKTLRAALSFCEDALRADKSFEMRLLGQDGDGMMPLLSHACSDPAIKKSEIKKIIKEIRTEGKYPVIADRLELVLGGGTLKIAKLKTEPSTVADVRNKAENTGRNAKSGKTGRADGKDENDKPGKDGKHISAKPEAPSANKTENAEDIKGKAKKAKADKQTENGDDAEKKQAFIAALLGKLSSVFGKKPSDDKNATADQSLKNTTAEGPEAVRNIPVENAPADNASESSDVKNEKATENVIATVHENTSQPLPTDAETDHEINDEPETKPDDYYGSIISITETPGFVDDEEDLEDWDTLIIEESKKKNENESAQIPDMTVNESDFVILDDDSDDEDDASDPENSGNEDSDDSVEDDEFSGDIIIDVDDNGDDNTGKNNS